MALIASLGQKAAPFKLPSLNGSFSYKPPSIAPYTSSPLLIPGLQPVSEHGQTGGSSASDTGAAPTPAQTGSATSGGSGYPTNPNYDSLLAGDTILNSGLTGLGLDQQGNLTGTGQSASMMAQLANSRKAAVESFGGVPDFSGASLASVGLQPTDIDQTTKDLASQNPNSVLASLNRQLATNQQASVANLAARGILRSGALGQHENENVTNFNQANYDAGQQLLTYLNGLWGNYQTGLGGLQTQRTDLINQALQRIIAQINAGTIGPTNTARIPTQVAPTPIAPGASYTDPSTGVSFNPPDYGPEAGYVPDGTVTAAPSYVSAPSIITAPGGGTYTPSGGTVGYQSHKGKYGSKVLL